MFDSLAKLERLERNLSKWLPADEVDQSDDARSGLPLLDFIPSLTPSWQRPDHLEPIASGFERTLEGDVRLLVSVPPQHGKAISVDEPILTRRGWVRAGEVLTGDELVASDGGWTRVLGTFPQGAVPLYRVTFSDGASVLTCAEHRWTVKQRYGCKAVVRTTRQLASDLFESDERHKWRIPVVAPLHGAADDLPLDPYLLGAWLGDGTSKRGEITSADASIVDAFRASGFRTSYEYPAGAAKTYGIPGLKRVLSDLGVLGNKHVPERYQLASRGIRLAVLQGLCDTDGTVAKNGSQQSFCTTAPAIAAGFRFLVNSLGGIWTEYQRPAATKTSHTISFRLPAGLDGFRLERKQSRLNAGSARSVPRRFVASIGPAGQGEAVCFAVDAEDHLYAVGRGLVLTHNTELIKHGLIWLWKQRPGLRNAYASYESHRAWRVSKSVRELAALAGLEPDGPREHWWTKGGGTLAAVGTNGALTGEPVDGVLVIDDPFKNRKDADSVVRRQDVRDFLTSTAETRMHPGASVIIVHTRWHPDDLIGTLAKQGSWEHINLPAINDGSDPRRPDGAALWESHRPLEWLRKKQVHVGPYDWASLYQGQPRPRGGTIFGEPHYYTDLPKHGFQVAHGIDLAYTAKTYADWSIDLAMLRSHDGFYYVVDVLRRQTEATKFADEMARKLGDWPGPVVWHCSGTEKGVASFIASKIPRLRVENATGDKFTRAQPVAAAWNEGKVLVPKRAEWLEPFLACVMGFTGVNDAQDDDVDALGSAYSALCHSPGAVHTGTIGAASRSRYDGLGRGFG